jgi:hypothetical protein
MFGQDRWTIATPFGDIELTIDEPALPRDQEDFEADSLAQTICYCIDTRDPAVTRAVVEIFCKQRRWQMPFGFDPQQLTDEHIDALRPELREFVLHGAESGVLKFRELDTFVAGIVEETAEVTPELQPPTEESPPEQDVCLPCQQRAAASARTLREAAASGAPFVS